MGKAKGHVGGQFAECGGMSTILQNLLVSWHRMETLQFSLDSCILHISWHGTQSTQIKTGVHRL